MKDSKRSVLITGCSDGGMGSEMAKEFHKAGLHVYATARDLSKMSELTDLGIDTLCLDIQSEASILECSKKVSRLDILVNNAGATYCMPVTDVSILEAKKIFDTNVWGQIATMQAFLPHLLKSPKAMVVNHTSIGVHVAMPFQSVYNASKAAISMFSDAMRLELESFNIAVVNLKSGGVQTKIATNVQSRELRLPEASIYSPAKTEVEKALRLDWFGGFGMPAEQWAKKTVAELLKETPPSVIWNGKSALLSRIASALPLAWFDGMVKSMTGLAKVQSILRKQ